MRNFVVHHLGEEFAVLRFVHWRIDHAHYQQVHPRMHRAGYIEAERRISAFVMANRNAVDEHLAEIIHRAEAQQHMASTAERGQIDFSPVPGCSHVVAQIVELHIP